MLSQFWPSSAVVLTDLNRNWWMNTPRDPGDLAVTGGLQVTVELAVLLSDKTLVASNRGHHPLTYIHGQQQILPSLEQNLTGMRGGEQKVVHLVPDDGFGQYDPGKRETVPREQLPADLAVGAFVRSSHRAGARVVEVDDCTAVLDLNHRLAGQSLNIEVKILRVEAVRGVFAGPALETAS